MLDGTTGGDRHLTYRRPIYTIHSPKVDQFNASIPIWG